MATAAALGRQPPAATPETLRAAPRQLPNAIALPCLLRAGDAAPWDPTVPTPAAPTAAGSPGPSATSAAPPTPITTPASPPSPTPTPAASPVTYEETSPRVRLIGSWRRVADPRASGGAYAASATRGDKAQIEISGDDVVLVRRVRPGGGSATLSVDGRVVGTVGFSFDEERWRVPAVFDRLGPRAHLLEVEVASDAEVTIDAFVAPSPHAPNPDQTLALARLNAHRSRIGIPAASLAAAANLGAQAHAEYDVRHREGHGQTPGKPGFVGRGPSQRVSLFGVDRLCGEVMHGYHQPVQAVDGWMESVYHRSILLRYGEAVIGFGAAPGSPFGTSVIDICEHLGPPPPNRHVYTFPADGQVDVPLAFGADSEGPDPLPQRSDLVGYPVSLYIAQPAAPDRPRSAERASAERGWTEPLRMGASDARHWPRTPGDAGRGSGTPGDRPLSVAVAEIRDDGNRALPAYVLHHDNDPHGLIERDEVFVIPEQPLQLGRTYRTRIAGEDSRGAAFDHTWSFATQVAAAIQGVAIRAGSCSARVTWHTAGPATAWLEYGSTAAYGERLTDPGAGTDHGVTLSDLAPATTYHYRIGTRDGQGHQRLTDDATFTTPSPRTLRVPGDWPTIAAALAEAKPCDRVEVAPGTYDGPFDVPDGVRLSGAGAGRSTVRGTGGGSVMRAGDGAEIDGFTITGSGREFWDAGIFIADNTAPVIRNNRFEGNSMAVGLYCFSPPCRAVAVITNNVMVGNSTGGVRWNEAAPVIVNNTIVDSTVGVGAGSPPTRVKNNVVVRNSWAGIEGAVNATVVTFNNVWRNGSDYGGMTPGPDARSEDPAFVDAERGDFHLRPDSRCRDAGDPDPAYNDPDGSRNDLGAYGGPAAE